MHMQKTKKQEAKKTRKSTCLYHNNNDCTELSLVLDNEALYEVYQKYMDLKQPTYANSNELIALLSSGMTSNFRLQSDGDIYRTLFDSQVICTYTYIV